jgi:NAD(P)-dependent dehydrogenase (short-subunit alcohol dehydrogenase family)
VTAATAPVDIRLDDQVAFVTAGANGLGAGIALSVARFGAHVVIADTDEHNGECVAAEIRALGRKALFLRTDMTITAEITVAAETAMGHFGRIDLLVNNAGGARPTPFMEHGERSWRRHLDLNLISMLAATQAVGRHMIAAGRGGSIINISSSEASRAAPGYAVYAACKAGMLSFTRTMALELAPHGIRVNALAPDMIATPGLQRYFDAATAEENAARDRYIPLGRVGTTDEFGAVVVFLASKMASYLTGVTIPVDAGALAASGWTRSPKGEWRLFHV